MSIKKSAFGGAVVQWLSRILIAANISMMACAMENKFDKSTTKLLVFNLIHPRQCTPEEVVRLIAQKADVNGVDEMGDTPLITALRFGCSRWVIRALVLHGADIDRGRSADSIEAARSILSGYLQKKQARYSQIEPNDPGKEPLEKALIGMLIAVGAAPKEIAKIRGFDLEAMKKEVNE